MLATLAAWREVGTLWAAACPAPSPPLAPAVEGVRHEPRAMAAKAGHRAWDTEQGLRHFRGWRTPPTATATRHPASAPSRCAYRPLLLSSPRRRWKQGTDFLAELKLRLLERRGKIRPNRNRRGSPEQ